MDQLVRAAGSRRGAIRRARSWRRPAMRTRRRSPARPGSTAGRARPPRHRQPDPWHAQAAPRSAICPACADRPARSPPRGSATRDTPAGCPSPARSTPGSARSAARSARAIAASATASRFSRRRSGRRSVATRNSATSPNSTGGLWPTSLPTRAFPSCSITACTPPSGRTAASATARGPSKKLTLHGAVVERHRAHPGEPVRQCRLHLRVLHSRALGLRRRQARAVGAAAPRGQHHAARERTGRRQGSRVRRTRETGSTASDDSHNSPFDRRDCCF